MAAEEEDRDKIVKAGSAYSYVAKIKADAGAYCVPDQQGHTDYVGWVFAGGATAPISQTIS